MLRFTFTSVSIVVVFTAVGCSSDVQRFKGTTQTKPGYSSGVPGYSRPAKGTLTCTNGDTPELIVHFGEFAGVPQAEPGICHLLRVRYLNGTPQYRYSSQVNAPEGQCTQAGLEAISKGYGFEKPAQLCVTN